MGRVVRIDPFCTKSVKKFDFFTDYCVFGSIYLIEIYDLLVVLCSNIRLEYSETIDLRSSVSASSRNANIPIEPFRSDQ